MQLLLARHGNTFGPGDSVVWVGRRNDLELVERGREQAMALAHALSEHPPIEIRHGPLKRTTEYAKIVAEQLGVRDVRVEPRLDELDYGRWGGLTRDEIVSRFGSKELDAWSDRSVWPSNAGWRGDERTVRREVRDLASELGRVGRSLEGSARVLLVSSNGRLRYFLDLVPGEFARRVEGRAFAMGTGKVGRIDLSRDGMTASSLRYWNVDPARGSLS